MYARCASAVRLPTNPKLSVKCNGFDFFDTAGRNVNGTEEEPFKTEGRDVILYRFIRN